MMTSEAVPHLPPLTARHWKKSWSSERFKFAKGVFQGDPLSPILFIWIFNPIINSIKEDPKLGITIKGHTIATLPFADDFCLITTNKRTHQKAIDTINDVSHQWASGWNHQNAGHSHYHLENHQSSNLPSKILLFHPSPKKINTTSGQKSSSLARSQRLSKSWARESNPNWTTWIKLQWGANTN